MSASAIKYRIQSAKLESYPMADPSLKQPVTLLKDEEVLALSQLVMGILHAEEGLCAVSDDRSRLTSVALKAMGWKEKEILEKLNQLPEDTVVVLTTYALSRTDRKIVFETQFHPFADRVKVATEGHVE